MIQINGKLQMTDNTKELVAMVNKVEPGIYDFFPTEGMTELKNGLHYLYTKRSPTKDDLTFELQKIQEIKKAIDDLNINYSLFGIDFQDEMATYDCIYCSFSMEFYGTTRDAMELINHDHDCPVTILRNLLK